MPTNITTATVLSTRVTGLLIEAQRVSDELAALPLNDAQSDVFLGLPAVLAESVLGSLAGAIYSAEQLDQRQRAVDLAVAQVVAGAALS